MVDNLLEISRKEVLAGFIVKGNCIFVKQNKLTACGLIENAAQTCSAIVGQSFFKKDDTNGESNRLIGFINNVKDLTIFRMPEVGQYIKTVAKLISRVDTAGFTICKMACETKEKNRVISSCEISLLIKPL